MRSFWVGLLFFAALAGCRKKPPAPPADATPVLWEKNPHILNRHVYQFHNAGSAAKKYWFYLADDMTGSLSIRVTSRDNAATLRHEPGGEVCTLRGEQVMRACELILTNPKKGEHGFAVLPGAKGGDFTAFFGLASDSRL